jgi:ADP-ribosyl-[dinitrogen reductase] hydrolase
MNRNSREHFRGCMLGGAVGDALGWPVEFKDLAAIRKEYGAHGIFDMVPGENGLFEITDDTQMTLFTAEGLLKAWATAKHSGGAPDFINGARLSYLCWLKTQRESSIVNISDPRTVGWLLAKDGLHRRRAPGNTCISALREGTYDETGIVINNSKGCGGVMRAAPAGLLATRINNGDNGRTARLAFEIGCSTAALTHGHPSGYYPAGVLAAIIAIIITGGSIEDGINAGIGLLSNRADSTETLNAIQSALDLWHDKSVSPSPEAIESLGGGWTGEESLAISLYCALVAGDDFTKGIRLAVNHSGDSDSTGSITGNILGALLGEQVIPANWLTNLELADVIEQIGNDLFTTFEGTKTWLKKYPPV